MQVKTLSSSSTVLYKFILPTLWILGFGAGTLFTWFSSNDSSLTFLVAWIIGSIVWVTVCCPLKRVRIGKEKLYISNYIHEIIVPFSAIKDVTEIRWINIRPVTIHFSCPNEFGTKVKFMPEGMTAFWKPHPVVSELKRQAGLEEAK
jgi:hypothetical protein